MSFKPASLGEAVLIDVDGELFRAKTLKSFGGKTQYRIRLREGGVMRVPRERLIKPCTKCKKRRPGPDGLCPKCIDKLEDDDSPSKPEKGTKADQVGFNQYGITWDKKRVNFEFKDSKQGLKVYGWWRKSKDSRSGGQFWAIDVFAKFQDKDLAVESITYTEEDPRENMKSLNADICAAINMWMAKRVRGGTQTITELSSAADRPTVYFNNIRSLDTALLKFREYRDTAIRLGGQRTYELIPDKGPHLFINIDVSTQAMVMKGKVPSLEKGSVFDGISGKRGDRTKGTKLVVTPDKANLKGLLDQLEAAKKAGDKPGARKLRSLLRSMGHRGGSRQK